MSQNETTPTGIAGAADYVPADQRAEPVCHVCGGELRRPVARIRPPHGIVQACGPACAADVRFAGRLVLVADV